jgi:hypothetical protein
LLPRDAPYAVVYCLISAIGRLLGYDYLDGRHKHTLMYARTSEQYYSDRANLKGGTPEPGRDRSNALLQRAAIARQLQATGNDTFQIALVLSVSEYHVKQLLRAGETMPLGATVGQWMSGRLCAVDEAFAELKRHAIWLGQHPAWGVFTQRVASLEAEVASRGGFDQELQDSIDRGSVFEETDRVNRYFIVFDLLSSMEDFAAAFFVTMQTRLNAIRVATERVYERAKEEDQIPVASTHQLPAAFWHVWHVANYVKHHDQWGAKLSPGQQQSFDVLKDLGVGIESSEPAGRFRVSWVVAESARKIADEPVLSHALIKIADLCRESSRSAQEAVQQDFAPFADQLKAVREANAKARDVRNAAECDES